MRHYYSCQKLKMKQADLPTPTPASIHEENSITCKIHKPTLKSPRMKKQFLIPLIALSLPFSSCTPVSPPDTDAQGNVKIVQPSSSLVSQGIKEFSLIKKKKKISHNSAYIAQTKRVATRLKRVIKLPGAQWEFIVFDDPTPNAFALPGGKVGIHSGLFQITQNDAGLAAVLGHEISHVTRNHAGARHKEAIGLAIGGLILDQISRSRGASDAERARLGAGYGAIATVGVALPHSRRAELEADRIGTLYMAKAGYDPREAIKMWQRFAAYSAKKGSARAPEFLRTHPLDTTRINALKAYLPTAMREYQRHR